ncbi:response regulator [Deinococcus peraridilitoris]|uniref:Response regulator with CheY-like receiver domain and winged-helix DNA-binding domain protein n=1 Tax=Deinococcus peraridilitoris (strain DSM 19664 / LMG 22246 / CIP 109416 / KR-200) TaxID=937777 RepID=K9ZZ40_DEIPD|nr:response regulator [Deinococcus peraridilitoris]AFZ66861.1 response regulator with CheY-like receiver domain and winged-helix DNA-binding domain protein [Deinococcus peraridilitoris DSM 19664]
MRSMHLLLVEDNDADVLLIQEALAGLQEGVTLHIVHDGEEALAFLRRLGPFADCPRPHFVLLDANTPKKNALEVLGELRAEPSFQGLPVVVFSTSASPRDVMRCYEAGANAYITKPLNLDEFLSAIENTLRFWASTALLPQSAPELPEPC